MATDPITLIVNGETTQVASDASVADVLQQMDIDPEEASGVAVALDDAVIPRAEWASTSVSDRSAIEVITATQGG